MYVDGLLGDSIDKDSPQRNETIKDSSPLYLKTEIITEESDNQQSLNQTGNSSILVVTPQGDTSSPTDTSIKKSSNSLEKSDNLSALNMTLKKRMEAMKKIENEIDTDQHSRKKKLT